MLYIKTDGLLIFNVQKHCPMYKNIARVYGPHTTYNEYYVQRVTKEIVRNDDDEDAI